MYIRIVKQKNANTGETYITHRLVETYRHTNGKVRQQNLLNLGAKFSPERKHWKLIADRVEEICSGQITLFSIDSSLEKEAQIIAKLLTAKLSDAPTQTSTSLKENSKTEASEFDFQTVDVNSLKHFSIRKVGAEHVGLEAAKKLQLDDILALNGINKKQKEIALASIICRLVHPSSERDAHRYLREQSGLDELMGTDFSKLLLNDLYKITDIIYQNKTNIEESLYKREKDLFNLDDVITLYDLTNTYFEGRSLENPKAQLGRSKEKRSDCPLVALGMVLDASGFPKKSKIFPGNVGEPETLQQMICKLEESKNVTVVMDAGIATEENIQWLRNEGYKYIVVSRKRKIVLPAIDGDMITLKATSNNEVKAHLIENTETDELELYCHSEAKEQKSRQMIDKFEQRFENELTKLKDGLSKSRTTKKYSSVLEKIGRLKEKYKRVGKRYEITVTPDTDQKKAIDIIWKKKPSEEDNDQLGYYCLRTNRKDLDEKTFWNIYTMLTGIESAFRSLKTELGMRPVFHRKEERVDAHIFIAILAYHLLHTIRMQLKDQGIDLCWNSLRDILETQCRITSTLSLKDGKTVLIRKTSAPDANQKIIYDALGIKSTPGCTQKTYL